MRAAVVSAALAALLLSGPARAADRPDLSGTWAVARPAPPAPGAPPAPPPARGDPGSGWGSPMTLVQTADALTLEYAFFLPGELQPPVRFAFPFDGAEATAVLWLGHGPLALRSRARWEGERLVVETAYPYADPATGAALPVLVTRTLSLAAPDTLVVETARAAVPGGRPTESRTVYTRP